MFFKRKQAVRTDDELMALVAKGDDEAFREILTRYQASILNLAFRLLGDAQEAKDIAQEVFLRLFQAADRYQPNTQFKSFLYRIARNLCFDYLEKKKPVYMDELQVVADSASPLAAIEREELSERVRRAVLSLPTNQRMALLLHHFDGLKYAEIAEAMNTSVSAVESLLVRAKRAMREMLKDLDETKAWR
jgi:RNA polymerase sigma-70 factor, ECF subfamily